MRIAIDTMAVRLAIFRGSNEEFYHLKSIADKCTEAKDSGNRLERIRNDYLFHLTLEILSKKPVLEKYQTHLLRQMEVMLFGFCKIKRALHEKSIVRHTRSSGYSTVVQ